MNVSDPLNILAPDGTTRRRKESSLSMSLDGERLARLETKVDLILEHQEAFKKSFEKHDERLKHLENTKAGIYGIAGAVGAMGAFLMDGLRSALMHR